MDESITIQTPQGDLRITLETFKAIRQKLLDALKQQQPPEDYVHLVEEVENSKPVIINGNAFIDGWKLIYRDNELLLERQQMPRARLMRFYEAPLEWRDEQWQVLSINVIKVRGR